MAGAAGGVQRTSELHDRKRAPGISGSQRAGVGGQVLVEVAETDPPLRLDRLQGRSPAGLRSAPGRW